MSGSFESVPWYARVHRLDLRLYFPPKDFGRNGVRTHVNSKVKILSTRKFSSEENRTHDAASNRTASPTQYQLSCSRSHTRFMSMFHDSEADEATVLYSALISFKGLRLSDSAQYDITVLIKAHMRSASSVRSRCKVAARERAGHGEEGATRGVAVSMSAFLACHQCYCAVSSLVWGLNLQAVVCDIF